jgi:hypothetical protein
MHIQFNIPSTHYHHNEAVSLAFPCRPFHHSHIAHLIVHLSVHTLRIAQKTPRNVNLQTSPCRSVQGPYHTITQTSHVPFFSNLLSVQTLRIAQKLHET